MHFKYFSVKEIQNFFQENGISVIKSRGQNFLINSGAVDTIIKNAGITSEDLVVEIGCGLGSLTHKILETGCRLTGFEIDLNDIIIIRRNRILKFFMFPIIIKCYITKYNFNKHHHL